MILKYKTDDKQSILEKSTIGPVLREIMDLNPNEILNLISAICKTTEYIEKNKRYSYYTDTVTIISLILCFYEESDNQTAKKAIENWNIESKSGISEERRK